MNMRDIHTTLRLSEIESIQEYRKWSRELPKFKFDSNWEVKIIPPFGQAIVRFCIDYNSKHVSVYFDAYDELGCVGSPYWEYYDGKECYRYLLGDEEEMMEDIRKFLNS